LHVRHAVDAYLPVRPDGGITANGDHDFVTHLIRAHGDVIDADFAVGHHEHIGDVGLVGERLIRRSEGQTVVAEGDQQARCPGAEIFFGVLCFFAVAGTGGRALVGDGTLGEGDGAAGLGSRGEGGWTMGEGFGAGFTGEAFGGGFFRPGRRWGVGGTGLGVHPASSNVSARAKVNMVHGAFLSRRSGVMEVLEDILRPNVVWQGIAFVSGGAARFQGVRKVRRKGMTG